MYSMAETPHDKVIIMFKPYPTLSDEYDTQPLETSQTSGHLGQLRNC